MTDDAFVELLFSRMTAAGLKAPTREHLQTIKDLMASFQADVDRTIAEIDAELPGGRKNPTWKDEMRKRMFALVQERLRNSSGGASG